MKHYLLLLTLALASIMALSSCSVNPREFLVVDTSMIHAGQSQAEVETILGQPDAKRKTGRDQEAWYYYHPRKRFYQRIPIIGKRLGRVEVEVLEVKFADNRVKKATFYVTHEKK